MTRPNAPSSRVEQTRYGFRWDDLEVERTATVVTHKGRKLYHCVTVRTPKRIFHLEITPTGLLSAFREFPNGV